MSLPSTMPSLESVDTASLPAGVNEELAGPPHLNPFLATRPVQPSEGISSVDLLRGFSSYKLYYAVAAMWIVNVAFSALWLRDFRFGPIEWCWRSLTYWQRQPMRLRTRSAVSTIAESA